jgi:hypothetical protein
MVTVKNKAPIAEIENLHRVPTKVAGLRPTAPLV